MATVKLSWAGGTGQKYKVEYKKTVDSTWILAIDDLTVFTYDVGSLDANTSYDFRVTSKCASGGTGTPQTVTQVTEGLPVWIEDTYTCAQDTVFTEISRVTGLSSPRFSYWNESQARMYVMDQDDSGGVFWWFNPNSWNTSTDKTYIAGTNTITQCYFAIADDQYKRLYATGLFTGGSTAGGLLVYDMVADNVQTIPYGYNGGSSFSRTNIFVEGNMIYCGDRNNNTFTLINRDTLTVNSTVNLNTIPGVVHNGVTKRLTGGCNLHFINNEIWCYNVGDSNSNVDIIIRYNTSLTTALGFIDVSMYRQLFQNNSVWGNSYYDASKNRFYGEDFATGFIFVVDPTSNTVVQSLQVTNRQGYSGFLGTFVTDPITGELYFSGAVANPVGSPDTSQIQRTYRLNRDSLYIEQVYPNLTFTQLTRQSSTRFLFGCVPNRRPWDSPNTGWNTDGIVIKFSR